MRLASRASSITFVLCLVMYTCTRVTSLSPSLQNYTSHCLSLCRFAAGVWSGSTGAVLLMAQPPYLLGDKNTTNMEQTSFPQSSISSWIHTLQQLHASHGAPHGYHYSQDSKVSGISNTARRPSVGRCLCVCVCVRQQLHASHCAPPGYLYSQHSKVSGIIQPDVRRCLCVCVCMSLGYHTARHQCFVSISRISLQQCFVSISPISLQPGWIYIAICVAVQGTFYLLHHHLTHLKSTAFLHGSRLLHTTHFQCPKCKLTIFYAFSPALVSVFVPKHLTLQ